MRSIGRVIVAAVLSAALVASCGVDTNVIGTLPDASAPAAFGEVDSGAVTAEAGLGLISYCPSSQCPPGWTTCPDSRFPCDTNILADSRNCGGCGIACPPGTGFEEFMCSEGACKLECNAANGYKDCDGLVDNGCESNLVDPTNCGACGVVCAVGQRCTWQDEKLTEVGCGCPPGMVDCGSCRVLRDDDNNCGACDNVCDPTGGPDAPQYSNMYYGCVSGQCGQLKCGARFADCDGDLENGCETSTFTDDDCGYCGNKCDAGQRCVVGDRGPSCMCDPGLTFCLTGEKYGLPEGYCVDVSSSVSDCGACFNSCWTIGDGYGEKPMCDFGKCAFVCLEGAADCNGSQSDGCEIDTKSDPRNCGGCGIACDMTMGQACVAGKCVVEPCDRVDAGEVTR